jgi:hypothetical protein
MGTLYRKICPACDGDTETNVTFDGFAGAAITNPLRGGEIVSDGYLAYIAGNGDLVQLPHPIESHALKAAGGTWNDAATHGRLLYIHNLICADCGTQNTTASLHVGGVGCGTGLVLGAIAISCNILLFKLHPIAAIIIAWIAMLAPSMLIDRYVRFLYHHNAVPHQATRCSACNGCNLVPLTIVRKRPVPCPRCRQKALTIEIAGRS